MQLKWLSSGFYLCCPLIAAFTPALLHLQLLLLLLQLLLLLLLPLPPALLQIRLGPPQGHAQHPFDGAVKLHLFARVEINAVICNEFAFLQGCHFLGSARLSAQLQFIVAFFQPLRALIPLTLAGLMQLPWPNI